MTNSEILLSHPREGVSFAFAFFALRGPAGWTPDNRVETATPDDKRGDTNWARP